MKVFRRHKRLVYVPGMISLLLLPVTAYIYFRCTDSFTVFRSMDIALPAKHKGVVPPPDGATITLAKANAIRHYKSFYFNGSEKSEMAKLDAMRREFRRLKASGDTTNGVKARFGKHSQYDTFIRTLDYLAIEEMPVWGLFGDEIYVLVPPPPKPSRYAIKTWSCGGVWNDLEIEEPSKVNIVVQTIKINWKIYTALAALMLINILSLIHFNKNKMLYLDNHSKGRF